MENHYNKHFDRDLKFGMFYEDKLDEILSGKMEIKTERGKSKLDEDDKPTWVQTKNIGIEYEYKGEPSGINITWAENWCHIFTIDDEFLFLVIIPTIKLKKICKKLLQKNKSKLVYGGDDNNSLLCLVPIKHLVHPHPPISTGTQKTMMDGEIK